jgi:glycine cleavage system H protein
MVNIKEGLLYCKAHEYVSYDADEGVATVGLSDYAQSQLGEIVYVELKWDDGLGGTSVSAVQFSGNDPSSDPIPDISVESQKAVGDLYAPISGEIVEANTALQDSPELINSDPYGAGWLFKIKPSDWDGESSSLLSADDYQAFIDSL